VSEQLDIFSSKQDGIDQAMRHADQVHPEWSERAYAFLEGFVKVQTGEFMTEDVRAAAGGHLPEPPSRRAWGGVIQRAAKSGLIRRTGYGKVKNKRAHDTPAAIWRRA
jgi:hypothetical protein